MEVYPDQAKPTWACLDSRNSMCPVLTSYIAPTTLISFRSTAARITSLRSMICSTVRNTFEQQWYRHFSWPYYWQGRATWGTVPVPTQVARLTSEQYADQLAEIVESPWGYDRNQGGLAHLGHRASDQTVGNILKRHGIELAPDRNRQTSWRTFIQSHWKVLANEIRLGRIFSPDAFDRC